MNITLNVCSRYRENNMGMCGGGGSSEPKVTPVERAQAVIAARNYNESLRDKPWIGTMAGGVPTKDSYLEDIMKDPIQQASAVKGVASADLAQKNAFPQGDVNQKVLGMGAPGPLNAKVMSDLDRDMMAKSAAAKAGFVSNAMGINTTVNQAQEGMAKDAFDRNKSNSVKDYENNAATTSSIASLSGAGSILAYDKMTEKKEA
jgi:hypothetical protein